MWLMNIKKQLEMNQRDPSFGFMPGGELRAPALVMLHGAVSSTVLILAPENCSQPGAQLGPVLLPSRKTRPSPEGEDSQRGIPPAQAEPDPKERLYCAVSRWPRGTSSGDILIRNTKKSPETGGFLLLERQQLENKMYWVKYTMV